MLQSSGATFPLKALLSLANAIGKESTIFSVITEYFFVKLDDKIEANSLNTSCKLLSLLLKAW